MNKQISFLLLILFLVAPLPAYSKDNVVVVKLSGAINPAVAEYVSYEISQANAEKDSLIVLHMDTPGGLDTSMREIIKKIQSSEVPVASFVAPTGSRAASAGTFITMASHIAAMAPGTNIGAAHPINMLGGGNDNEQAKTMKKKTTVKKPVKKTMKKKTVTKKPVKKTMKKKTVTKKPVKKTMKKTSTKKK